MQSATQQQTIFIFVCRGDNFIPSSIQCTAGFHALNLLLFLSLKLNKNKILPKCSRSTQYIMQLSFDNNSKEHLVCICAVLLQIIYLTIFALRVFRTTLFSESKVYYYHDTCSSSAQQYCLHICKLVKDGVLVSTSVQGSKGREFIHNFQ